MRNSLDRYLQTVLTQGDQLSSGHFTVDEFQAERKLGQHQLQNAAWIPLKLIQSAVASKALCVLINVRRKDLTISFPLPKGASLEEFPTKGSIADELMGIGLRSAAQLGPWTFQVQGHFGGFRLDFDGEKETKQTLEARDGLAFLTDVLSIIPGTTLPSQLRSYASGFGSLAVFHFRRKIGWWDYLTAAGMEHALIASRTDHCPIPVILDGCLQNRSKTVVGTYAKELCMTTHKQPAVLGPAPINEDTSLLSLPWRDATKGTDSVIPHPQFVRLAGIDPPDRDHLENSIALNSSPIASLPQDSAFRISGRRYFQDEQRLYQSWIMACMNPEEQSYLWPIKYGVTLEALKPPGLKGGCEIFHAADELADDLSGAGLLENSELEQLFELYRKRVHSLVDDAQKLGFGQQSP